MASDTSKKKGPKKGFHIKNPFRSTSRDHAMIPICSTSLDSIAPPCDSSATNPARPGPNDHLSSNVSERQKLGLVLLTPVLPADQIDELSPDIIAIHGICGDPLKTWTHESGALWLRDFLPKDINGLRVFSFGYDAEVALTKSRATIDSFARSLLNNIKLERDGKQQSRPLIFICHSMGGIVLKKALTIARLEDEDEFPFLRTSIRGIFFLGTPHRGTDAIRWPQLLANISTVSLYVLSGLTGSTRKDLLQNLDQNSEILKTISTEFRNQAKDIKIFSCIEQRATLPHPKLIVDEHTGILGFPGEVIKTMDGCDHRTMCRFSNKEDLNYRFLESQIKGLLDTSEQAKHGQSTGTLAVRGVSPEWKGSHQEMMTTDQADCLKYLYFKDMEARQHEIVLATETTCEWLLQHSEFRQWTLQNRGLLWIKGNPGTGKSTIMKYVLQEMSHSEPAVQSKLVILSFFFHGRGSTIQHTPVGFYRSILHQILDHIPSALSDLVTDFRKNCEVKGKPGEKWDWHEVELRAFLRSSIPKILEHYSIRIFVDALDESGETAAVELVKEFQNLIQRYPNTPGSVFSICFSCRRYPIINVKGGLEICIDQENSEDIRTYIQSQLQDEKHQIVETIIQRASNSFQWARLVVDRVEHMRRNGKKEKMINEEILRIPPDLNNFYREILESISKEDLPEVLNLIQWILFALEPLSLDEFRFATAIDPHLPYTSLRQCEDEGILAENNNEMEKRVKSLSRGLVEIQLHDDIPMVQFIHQSVNDFLFDDGLQTLFGERWESLDLAIGLAHNNLSRSCIRYIDMEEIAQQKNIDWKEAAKSELPFLRYATTSWLPHAEQAYTKRIPQVDLLNYFYWPSGDLLGQWDDIYNAIEPRSMDCPARNTTLLHIAAEHGMVDLLSAALGTLNEIDLIDLIADSIDDDGRTPLSWAAERGHVATIKLLLATGKVDVDSRDMTNWTPLLYAAWKGHAAIIELLLATGKVDANSKDKQNRAPLFYAAKHGHIDVIKLLLATGKVKANSKDKEGQTPLSWATWKGHMAIVELLRKYICNL
ncbi:nb-arc and ankyrin domain-containing protein [Hyaloscypha finlandica]|nr:nb-arc and ankyrin domain-containing protein [Hyaloscypha finlandica]